MTEMISQTTILIIEDDPKTAMLVETYLRNDGFNTVSASEGPAGLELFRTRSPQLVILDVMLPKSDGFMVCTEIRKCSGVPILFLSARDHETDKVLALGLGADDFVSKPLSPRELVARVKALLRRAGEIQPVINSQTESFEGLSYDSRKRRFASDGGWLELTPIEHVLLFTLFSSPGRVFLRSELLDRLYPNGEVVVDRVIDVHIGKLRQKIGDDPASPRFIHTVRGAGYRFSDPS